MAQYTGRLQGSHLQPSGVVIDISDDRFRVSAGRTQIGSWPLPKIHAERTSIYRFDLSIDGDQFEFFPDDPSAFSNAVGAVVDLTETKGRFGLKARIEQAAAND
ncbi:MAG: hypothetical protein U9N56_00610 [Actinomycetota bacterium]|nr:hypothetical protein [Actinomycetota bacterium]